MVLLGEPRDRISAARIVGQTLRRRIFPAVSFEWRMGKGCLSDVPDVFARPGLGDGPGLTAFVPGGDSLRPLTFVGRTVLFGTTQKPRSPEGLWKRKTRRDRAEERRVGKE